MNSTRILAQTITTILLAAHRRNNGSSMKAKILTIITSIALFATLNVAAQDHPEGRPRNRKALTTHVQSPADASGEEAPPHNYWSLLSQIVDDQNGAPSVDPLTLHPVPLLQHDGVVFHTYKACWQVAHPGRLDPPGTAIKCYSSPATFELGDGSLASDPTGNPDTFFSGVVCPVTGPQQFSTADQAAAYWNAVRLYNASGQLIEGYRNEAYIGKFYNYTTGTSIPLWADYVVDYVEEPGPDGTENNEQDDFYGNDFTVLAGSTLVVTPPWGSITYSPAETLVAEVGPHPIDDYYNLGTTAPFVPICTALE